ncbi:MAG: F0F1 ATP synthase subunit A [Bacillota bacterium]
MHSNRPLVKLFGLTFDLSIILTTSIAALIVFMIIVLCTRKLKERTPGKWQNFLEWMIEQVENIMHSSIGNRNNLFILSFGVVLFLYLFIANMMGIPFSFVAGEKSFVWWKSPTADPHITMTMSIMMIVYIHFIDIRLHGIKKYLLSYIKPIKVLLPINVLEQFSTSQTLGLRLFGNIYAGEVMLTLLASSIVSGLGMGLLAAVPMVLWQAFCIFIAYLFVLLTMVYIGQRVNEASHA